VVVKADSVCIRYGWGAWREAAGWRSGAPAGGLGADREPPTAFSLRVENAPMARGVSGKTHALGPIIVAAMHEFAVPARS
jgi:hypothetical protein